MKRLVTLFSMLCLVLTAGVPAFAGKPVGDTTKPITSATPTGGTYFTPQSVTLTVNEPATTYYTTDGSPPATSSPVYTAAINIAATTTLTYFSQDSAGNLEAAQTQQYTISGGSTHSTLTWTGYTMCKDCHAAQAQGMYQSSHYQWKGSATDWTSGPAVQGKMDATDGSSALNAYCINIQGNWNPCAVCHLGTGAKPEASQTPSDAQLSSIDCLMCHSQTYSRVRNPTTGLFAPNAALNMNSVVQNISKPTRKNCLGCHAKAGGGRRRQAGRLGPGHHHQLRL